MIWALRNTDLSLDQVGLKHHVGIVGKDRTVQLEIKAASVEVVGHQLARLSCEAAQLPAFGEGPIKVF